MSTLPYRSALILVTLALAVSGCGILSSPEQRDLYQVKAAASIPAGLPHRAVQLTIGTVDAPAGLDTVRIALSRSPVSLDYFAGAAWSDRAPPMVRNALVESFENSGAFAAIGADNFNLHADYLLKTEMRDFEAVYDSPSGNPVVTVVLSLKLVKLPAGTIVGQTVIAEREAAAANAIPTVVGTFSSALGKAISQAVAWTATNAALIPARR